MISRLTGQLVDLFEDSVILEHAGVGFIINVPRYALGEIATFRGREITLHTLLFVDSNATSGHVEPQLIGFLHPEDKLFFRKFISVKGIGPRRALKAMTEPPGHIAVMIEDADLTSLKQLPGIGARAADLIVAELRGKLKEIALASAGRLHPAGAQFSQEQRDALEIMVSLGDDRIDSQRWLERAAQLHSDVRSADEWVRAAYRIKIGAEG